MSAHCTAAICNLGCKVNFYESEFYAQELDRLGIAVVPFANRADIYIINTCTVTAESDRKCMQMVRRATAKNPNALIIVTGCLAQIDPKRIASVPGVDAVIGNTRKLQVLQYVEDYLQGTFTKKDTAVVDTEHFTHKPAYEPMQLLRTEHARATVKIEDGCNSHCAYCIISKARGPARSKKPEDTLAEVRHLAAAGYKEVILTGIELASYEGDLPELIRQISQIPGIERIRLGSLDPAYLTPSRVDQMTGIPKLMPHFHISLQSGSTATLNRMRRKYNAEMAMKNILHMKACFPEAQFFGDIIVGFPGETEEHFTETMNFIRKVGFLHLHIFPYSRRAGTEAAAMEDQIPKEIKRRRAAELALVQKDIKRGILEQIIKEATPLPVLFETESEGVAFGHTHHFIETEVPGLTGVRGQIRYVLPVATDGERLTGIPTNKEC